MKTDERVDAVLKSMPVKDADKLKKQQNYYERLSKKGIAQKETYNLKPISCI